MDVRYCCPTLPFCKNWKEYQQNKGYYLCHLLFDIHILHFKLAVMSVHKDAKRITTQVVYEMKENGEKIAMLTSYDYSMAKIVDQAGIDIILVGDSASN